MFFSLPDPTKSVQTKLTLKDLNAAIEKFAVEHSVSSDIFFELLFGAATEYFITEYAAKYQNLTPEQAQDYLFGEGKLRSSRPLKAWFEVDGYRAYSSEEEDEEEDDAENDTGNGAEYRLAFQEQASNFPNDTDDALWPLNSLWEEVVEAYFQHKLGHKFREAEGMFTTANWKGYASRVEMPIDALIKTFLPSCVARLPTVLADEEKKQAYALPGCKLNYKSLVKEVNDTIAAHNIETSYCDVFEFAVCNILGVSPLPTDASFYPKCSTNYLDFKEHLCMCLELEPQAAYSLVANAKKLYPDAIKQTSNLNGKYNFEVKYRFIEQFILPKLSILLEDVEFRNVCQTQYAESTADQPWAIFYAHHHGAKKTAPNDLKM